MSVSTFANNVNPDKFVWEGQTNGSALPPCAHRENFVWLAVIDWSENHQSSETDGGESARDRVWSIRRGW
jgi:hypothetical protein